MFRGDYSRRCLSYTFGIKRPATIIGLENNLGLYQLGKQAIVTRTCFEPKLNFSTVFSGELRLGKEYVMPPKNSIDIYLYMYKSGKYLAMPDLPLHKKYFSLSKSIL
jgi:hypothetical protein